MQLRKFEQNDAEELAELFRTTIWNINKKDYSEVQLRAWAPENRDMAEWIRSFDKKFVIVAIHLGKLCGFGELKETGYIDRFYIHHESIGSGVGRKIYQALEDHAQEMGLERLFVDASITAKPFFKKMGFINPGEQRVLLRGVEFINYRMEKFL